MVGDVAYGSGVDPVFGFLAGLYAAALVAPAVTVGVALAATTDAAVLFVTFLGVTVGAVTGVARVARREAFAVRLGGTRWAWLVPLVGAYHVAVLLVASGSGPASDVVVGVSTLGAVGGVVSGVGLAFAAHNRHAKAVIAESDRCVRFSARGPERDRRLAKWAVGALVLGGVVGLAGSVAFGLESTRWLFHLLVGAGAGLMGANAERTFVVADAGLRVGTPVHKRVRPWTAFESYSLTDDALVIHRTGWSMGGLRDVRRDPDEIENLPEVTATLDEFLPRRGDRSAVRGASASERGR